MDGCVERITPSWHGGKIEVTRTPRAETAAVVNGEHFLYHATNGGNFFRK